MIRKTETEFEIRLDQKDDTGTAEMKCFLEEISLLVGDMFGLVWDINGETFTIKISTVDCP